MSYTKIELLEEARARFPIGTKYYHMNGEGVEDNTRVYVSDRQPYAYTDLSIEVGRGYIYSSSANKWARKVELVNNNYDLY